MTSLDQAPADPDERQYVSGRAGAIEQDVQPFGPRQLSVSADSWSRTLPTGWFPVVS